MSASLFTPVYSGTTHSVHSFEGGAFISTNRNPKTKWFVPNASCLCFELEVHGGGPRNDIGAVLEIPGCDSPTTISLDVAEALANFYGEPFLVKTGSYTLKLA